MGQTRCLTRITQRIIDSSETDHPSREWKRPFIARITPTHAEYDITLDINLVQSDRTSHAKAKGREE